MPTPAARSVSPPSAPLAARLRQPDGSSCGAEGSTAGPLSTQGVILSASEGSQRGPASPSAPVPTARDAGVEILRSAQDDTGGSPRLAGAFSLRAARLRQPGGPAPRFSFGRAGGLLAAALVLALLAAPASGQAFEREAAPFPVTVDGAEVPFPFAGGFFEPRPTLADLDGDGDADLVVNVGGAGLQLYERTDAGWTWRTDRLGGVEPGNWHTFGDLDGDGDLDLLTRGAPGRVRFWRNVGPGDASPAGFPTFELAADGLTTTSGEPVAVEDSSIPALGDVDGDGDPRPPRRQGRRGDDHLPPPRRRPRRPARVHVRDRHV